MTNLLSKIQRGKLVRPLRIVLYGVEGVGKSTFGSQAPRPVFLCAEDGTAQLDVDRLPQPKDWAEVMALLGALAAEEHAYNTLVVDTLDWLEPLVWAAVCKKASKSDIEAFGYGKGYVAALDEWRVFLARLEALQRAKSMHVVLLAHASPKPHKDPSIEQEYKRWALKLHASAAGLLSEWADAVLFAVHESFTAKSDGKVRGVSTGERVLKTTWTAAHHAKNRFGLPETLPLDWLAFAEAALPTAPVEDPNLLLADLQLLIDRLPEAKQAIAREQMNAAGDDPAQLQKLISRATKTLNLTPTTETTTP